MLSNAYDQVAFLARKTNAGGSGIQFDDTHESIGLVPDSHRAINTAWREQPHFGAASQSCDVIHVIRFTAMIKPLWNNIYVC